MMTRSHVTAAEATQLFGQCGSDTSLKLFVVQKWKLSSEV